MKFSRVAGSVRRGSNPTIFGIRMSLIGDTIMALPMLKYFEDYFGEYTMIFSIAKKCQQAKNLYLNQKNIDYIKISDEAEGLGPQDEEIINQCNIFVNPTPDHHFFLEQDWYNYRSCVDETLLMGGINPDSVRDKTPSLTQHWESPESFNKKVLCIWPFAGYGATQMAGTERSPSPKWWKKLITELVKKRYKVCHFGMECEPDLSRSKKYYKRFTNLSFFEQVQLSLCCGCAIGTDSGSMWVLGAYNKMPQINLLTNWQKGHKKNFLALAPVSEKSINIFAEDGCDNIGKEDVLAALKLV